MLIAVLAY